VFTKLTGDWEQKEEKRGETSKIWGKNIYSI
jgi:hypothetical protein